MTCLFSWHCLCCTAVLAQSATILNVDPSDTLQGEIIGVGAEGTTYVLSEVGETTATEVLTRKGISLLYIFT